MWRVLRILGHAAREGREWKVESRKKPEASIALVRLRRMSYLFTARLIPEIRKAVAARPHSIDSAFRTSMTIARPASRSSCRAKVTMAKKTLRSRPVKKFLNVNSWPITGVNSRFRPSRVRRGGKRNGKNLWQKNGGIACLAAIFLPSFFCLKISERFGARQT